MYQRRKLFDAVDNCFRLHVGGPKFFDAVDSFVKSNIKDFRLWVEGIERRFPSYPIVLSGEFGYMIGQEKRGRIILPGGLRYTKTSMRRHLRTPFVFVDDSLHSGKTLRAIQEITNSKAHKVIVVYDGSKMKNVEAMFHYYGGHRGQR